MPTPEELRQTYSNFPDGRLIQIATEEASDLLPEATFTIRQELKRRGLDVAEAAVVAQQQPWTPYEAEQAADELRSIPCPMCRSSSGSPLVSCKLGKQYFLGCPECIQGVRDSKRDVILVLAFFNPLHLLQLLLPRNRPKACELKEYVIQNPGKVIFLLGMNKQLPVHKGR